MNISDIKLLQTLLINESPVHPGKVDGKIGPRTQKSVISYLYRKVLPNEDDTNSYDFSHWSAKQQAILCLQYICTKENIDAGKLDGYWGPQTDYAVDQLKHLVYYGRLPKPWRDKVITPNPNNWPKEIQNDLINFYGNPGARLILVDLPYPMTLAWDLKTTVTRTTCHEKVAESLVRVLSNVLDKYGEDKINKLFLNVYGGGYNNRTKRGGSTLSMHAWGIAFDFDPMHNKLKWGRDKAHFARPEYDQWWRCWEDEGWTSLGRKRNFDWMHVQATHG